MLCKCEKVFCHICIAFIFPQNSNSSSRNLHINTLENSPNAKISVHLIPGV